MAKAVKNAKKSDFFLVISKKSTTFAAAFENNAAQGRGSSAG